MILITGGSGSGKSEFAESVVLQEKEDRRFYLATMKNQDEESNRRIRRHRVMRKEKGFLTIEAPINLQEVVLPQSGVVLLECLSNLTANEMFQKIPPEDPAEHILAGITSLRRQCTQLVIVTNEIFSDGVLYDEYTTRYLQILGQLNQICADKAEKVYEVVYGIPVLQKGKL